MNALRRRLGLERSWSVPPFEPRGGRVLLRPRPGGRLHLGCGDVRLPGYLNVDFPPEDGVASGTSAPDLEADILALDCADASLAEIRLHHVFEHFERAVALALLVRWLDWLEPGGLLVVETPDFERCIETFAERTPEQQSLILRHLFGSQEAPWARHLDGWSETRFREVMGSLGFERIEVDATSSDEAGLLVNVLVHARRPAVAPPREERVAAALALLRRSMNGVNPTEERLAERWVKAFERTLAER